jgi:VanZ family protein
LFKFLEKNKKFLVYTPLVIYWIILFISTSLPLENVPSIGLSDKFMHTVAYTGLAVLLYLTLKFQKKFIKLNRLPVLYTFLIGMAYGGFDELHQLLVPGRKCDIIDLIADGIGIVTGLLITSLVYRLSTKKN